MPVTTRASPVEVKPAQKLGTYDAEKLLSASAPSVYHPWEGKKLLDSSFVDTQTVSPAHNGFIETVLDAYNRHHHLVLRPEDVWFAILVQFSFYVNKHSENLRKYFVEHEGKKKLKVETESGMRDVVLRMTDLITENVKDPSLRGWIMPSFTTTTQQDRIAAAIIMMGTMQKYFVYMCEQTCGIPSVTLLGEKSDWEDMKKVETGYHFDHGFPHTFLSGSLFEPGATPRQIDGPDDVWLTKTGDTFDWMEGPKAIRPRQERVEQAVSDNIKGGL
jgi:hypothetical protein